MKGMSVRPMDWIYLSVIAVRLGLELGVCPDYCSVGDAALLAVCFLC